MRRTLLLAVLFVLAAGGITWVLSTREKAVVPDASLGEVADQTQATPAAAPDPPRARPGATAVAPSREGVPAARAERGAQDVDAGALPSAEVVTPLLRGSPSPDGPRSTAGASAPAARPWTPPVPPLSRSFRDPDVFSIEAEEVARGSEQWRPGVLAGSVLKPDGTPVAGGFVRLHARQALGEVREPTWVDLTSIPVLGRTRTRSDGTFAFLRVPDAEYVVTFDPVPRLSHAWRFVVGRKGRFGSTALRPSWRAIVRVVDEDGKPVVRASVSVEDLPEARAKAAHLPRWVGAGRVYEDGTCFLEGRAHGSTGRLSVQSGSRDCADVELASWTVADETIVLPRLYEVTGRLTGAEGLHRWDVALWAKYGGSEWKRIKIPEDRLEFQLARIPKGPVMLKAHRTDVASFDPDARDTVVEAGAKDVLLPVDAGESLVVRVAGWPRLNPPGLPAYAWKSGQSLEYDRMTHAVSGDGLIRIRGVRAGTRYDVWVPSTGHSQMCALGRALEPGSTEHALQPVPIPTLEGRVTEIPEGNRGVNMKATCEGWTVEGGPMADGTFTLVLPPLAGPWTIRADTRRVAPAPRRGYEWWEGSAVAAAGSKLVTIRLEQKPVATPAGSSR